MNRKVPGEGRTLAYRLLDPGRNRRLPGEDISAPDNAGVQRADIKWCTMACEHAAWPRENVDGANSCRTFNAIWCRELGEHVTRNTPCALEHGARRPKPNW
ncbi:MAG: hypothetical protein MAG453_00398 [Calditrichaeota bacterium]|nr:hypothetical protein [Calditrichota bacterium]